MNPKLLLCLALLLCSIFAINNAAAAIIYPQEPEGGRHMVMQFADYFIGEHMAPFKDVSTTNDLTFAPPLPDYAAGDLTKGKLLAGATVDRGSWQGWKYIFMRGTNAVGAAWLETDNKTGRPLKCTSLVGSILCGETEMALRKAGQWPQVQKADYETRLLSAPWLSFEAVWLHGQTDDIIIPLPPTYNRMSAYQPYSENQIITILEPEAKRDAGMWAKLNTQRQHDENAYARAMTDYEKAHGGNGTVISYYGYGAPFQKISPDTEIMTLEGKSSQGEELHYRAKVTYGQNRKIVAHVEILEKLP